MKTSTATARRRKPSPGVLLEITCNTDRTDRAPNHKSDWGGLQGKIQFEESRGVITVEIQNDTEIPVVNLNKQMIAQQMLVHCNPKSLFAGLPLVITPVSPDPASQARNNEKAETETLRYYDWWSNFHPEEAKILMAASTLKGPGGLELGDLIILSGRVTRKDCKASLEPGMITRWDKFHPLDNERRKECFWVSERNENQEQILYNSEAFRTIWNRMGSEKSEEAQKDELLSKRMIIVSRACASAIEQTHLRDAEADELKHLIRTLAIEIPQSHSHQISLPSWHIEHGSTPPSSVVKMWTRDGALSLRDPREQEALRLIFEGSKPGPDEALVLSYFLRWKGLPNSWAENAKWLHDAWLHGNDTQGDIRRVASDQRLAAIVCPQQTGFADLVRQTLASQI